MLEMILDNRLLFVLMGVMTVLGIVSKLVANVTLKRLVRAAGNMNKSTHPLMRLVRAKFEHACMISDKVENVSVFVDKYLYEYKVAGMKLHSWRRMEKAAAGMCLLLGASGAVLEYAVNGIQDMVLKTGATGAGLAILTYLVHLTTDENYRLDAVHNYMVDYLENVCLRKYEKSNQKELKVMAPEVPIPEFGAVSDKAIEEETKAKLPKKEKVEEPKIPDPIIEIPVPKDTQPEMELSVVKDDLFDKPELKEQIQAARKEKEHIQAAREEKKEEHVTRDVMIRQILEEFMA